jgi:alpha-mannosidase
LNQPLIAFESTKHPGPLGKTFSIMKLNTNRVRVLALKKAEETDEIIVRVVELDGRGAQDVRLSFPAPVIAAREVNGQEQPLGKGTIIRGQLITSLGKFQPRTFAIKLARPSVKSPLPLSQPIPLPYDLAGSTNDGERVKAGFDGEGAALPAELLPRELPYSGITFRLASGKVNVHIARGQTISIPTGVRRLYVLAASTSDDETVRFRLGNEDRDLKIQSWRGFIGQWDNRQWKRTEVQLPPRTPPPDIPPDIAALLTRSRTRIDQYGEMLGITPGFIKRAPVAWFASHHHNAAGANEAYAYSYLFSYEIDVPANGRTLTLPNNDSIRILAITGSNERERVKPAQLLYGL